jgi:hypothetical protein
VLLADTRQLAPVTLKNANKADITACLRARLSDGYG